MNTSILHPNIHRDYTTNTPHTIDIDLEYTAQSTTIFNRTARIMNIHYFASLMAIIAIFSHVTPTYAQKNSQKQLVVGIHVIDADVANTPYSREKGLMYRTSLAPNQGMLFVFDQAAQHCMWMKNTPLPLSVAFIDARGNIINIEKMRPHTDTRHCAIRPAQYALEMNENWFDKKNVRPGMTIEQLEK